MDQSSDNYLITTSLAIFNFYVSCKAKGGKEYIKYPVHAHVEGTKNNIDIYLHSEHLFIFFVFACPCLFEIMVVWHLPCCGHNLLNYK